MDQITDPATTGSVDPWTSALPTVAVAVIGVIGLAFAAWIAARSALRIRLIDLGRADIEDNRDFLARAVAAANELGIAMSRVIDAHERNINDALATATQAVKESGLPPGGTIQVQFRSEPDPEVMAREARALDAWRAAIAEGHYHADTELSRAFTAYDVQRSKAVEAINSITDRAHIGVARDELKRLREQQGRQLYRALQRSKLISRNYVAHLAKVWRVRRFARQWSSHLEAGIREVDAMIERATQDDAQRDGVTS